MHNEVVTSILLVGVGGQGMVLDSKVLSQVAMKRGLDVKLSEINGMAQRGGLPGPLQVGRHSTIASGFGSRKNAIE